MIKKQENRTKPLPRGLLGIVILLSLLIILFLIINDTDGLPEQGWVISERGILDVFPEGMTDDEGNTIFCETSAIAYDGKYLIMGSDKPIPGDAYSQRSSVFYTEYAAFPEEKVLYFTAPAFIEAIKYEDFTVTPDGQYIIATTGFDRVHHAGTSEWDNYNTMMIWPVGKPDDVKIVSPSTEDGVTSSVSLREKISSALKTKEFPDGVPYFKIEGLAAVPGNQLLLGIREMGATYELFDYVIMIISVSYDIVNGELVLSDDYRLIYHYDPTEKLSDFGEYTVALSSIEYDRFNDRIYMLTSYEKKSDEEVTDEDIGAFLWLLPLQNLDTKKVPELVLKGSGLTPLMFAHKGEGVTVINPRRVIIIHDDDRVLGRENIVNSETQFSRHPNQAAYTIVDFYQ